MHRWFDSITRDYFRWVTRDEIIEEILDLWDFFWFGWLPAVLLGSLLLCQILEGCRGPG